MTTSVFEQAQDEQEISSSGGASIAFDERRPIPYSQPELRLRRSIGMQLSPA